MPAITEELEQERYKKEIQDAQLLLDFALTQSGSVREAPIAVSDALVSAVKSAENQLLLDAYPPPAVRAKFEIAYRDLAQLVSPVTAKTLRDTSDAFGR